MTRKLEPQPPWGRCPVCAFPTFAGAPCPHHDQDEDDQEQTMPDRHRRTTTSPDTATPDTATPDTARPGPPGQARDTDDDQEQEDGHTPTQEKGRSRVW